MLLKQNFYFRSLFDENFVYLLKLKIEFINIF